MRPWWHYFLAALVTIIVQASYSEFKVASRAAPNFVMISAREHTQAAHDAVAALHIPNLMIMDSEKLPKPGFGTFLFVRTISVTITVAIFLIALWLIGSISHRVSRPNQALEPTAGRCNKKVES